MRYCPDGPEEIRKLTPTIEFTVAELYLIGGFTDVSRCTDPVCHEFVQFAIETALRASAKANKA